MHVIAYLRNPAECLFFTSKPIQDTQKYFFKPLIITALLV